MQDIYEGNAYFIPTLRLSITDMCYGKCSFCHREGQKGSCAGSQMSLNMIDDYIIPAINSIGIKKVVLTGGEPTLHSNLVDIARSIRCHCSSVHIGITTNGFNTTILQETAPYLDKITISVSSYNPNVYMKYTGIDPFELIRTVNDLQVKKKAASIVITNDNYEDVVPLVTDLLNQAYEVKLQFVIGNEWVDDCLKYRLFQLLCNKLGRYGVKIEATPTIYWKGDYNTEVRFKLGSLNRFIYDNLARRKICINCIHRNNCVERGCAIRVYPTGIVSPCLDNYNIYNNSNVRCNIENAYSAMQITH